MLVGMGVHQLAKARYALETVTAPEQVGNGLSLSGMFFHPQSLDAWRKPTGAPKSSSMRTSASLSHRASLPLWQRPSWSQLLGRERRLRLVPVVESTWFSGSRQSDIWNK